MGHHAHTDAAGASHGSTKQYVIGLIISIVLTIIPFWMVMQNVEQPGSFGRGPLVWTIVVTAIAQVLVQLVFFLHLNSSSEQRWNLIAFVYTVLTIAILIIGSIWVMDYLHYFMMS
ncbi:cytochrome o ubiquinol oxidase subunit IV [Alkanindiges illinoisensis]|uniref:cytochrome o ubiquinol oxidase subunit IV n=1 Tax=Alkanindiges illinoisensis TaxID=197183 RepID=UPI000478CEFC|nr:cytochrome o ubiquinol oxidase subunit IV [Alkanindiges illinoisensis]